MEVGGHLPQVLDLLRIHPFLATEEPTTVAKSLVAFRIGYFLLSVQDRLFLIFDLSVGRILQPMCRLIMGSYHK